MEDKKDLKVKADKYTWHEGDVRPFDTLEEALAAEPPYEPEETNQK